MRLVLVSSPKGGVGVTTVAAELARRLAAIGRDVIAVNLTHQPALGYRLSGQAGPDTGYNDAPMTLTGVVYRSTDDSHATSQSRADFALAQRRADTIVIVDVSSSDRETRTILAKSADLTLCILAADAGSLAVLPQAIKLEGGNPHFVLSLVDERRAFAADVVTLFSAVFGDRLIGTIRYDEAVNEALARLAAIAPGSVAADDFGALAVRIGEMLPPEAVKPNFPGVA